MKGKEQKVDGERVANSTFRILHADDHLVIRQSMFYLIESKHPDWTVDLVENGDEALRMMARADQPYDVVITDLVMPVMNGIELARRINQGRNSTPVILISGYLDGYFGEPKSQEWFQQNGFLCAFPKSKFEELDKRLQEIYETKLRPGQNSV